jgi:hypothetical protein
MRISHGILVFSSVLVCGCNPNPSSTSIGSGGNSSHPNGGSGGGSGASGSGGKSSNTATGGGAGTGSGTGGAGGAGGATTTVLACVPGVPPTSQIPRMKDAAYDAVISDLLGLTALSNNGNQPPSSLLSPDSDGAITDIGWNGYLSAAQEIAAEVMAGTNKSKFISCDPTKDTSCLTNTVKSFGRKAFRRPLTDAELTSFMRLNSLTPAGKPLEVAESILYAFLASPSFIQLPELAQDKDGSNVKLNSYEVATRLSFLLWGTVPDDTLNSAAESGQLTTKDQISAQAQRMLKSDKAKAVVTNFLRYYAGIETGSHWVNNSSHDSSKYPAFTDASYAPAMAEMDAFFQDVVLGGGAFKDLFLGNNAFVSKDTAALYGLAASSYGTQLTKVALDANQRPGFLTRVGFLSTFSKYDVTSAILRGAFISGRVLGVNPGTPNPKFTGLPIPAGDYTTQRQAIEALTAGEPCHSCHGININPSGFVLEHYNSVGMWQDTDPLGGAIDGTADVRFSATDTKTITKPVEMMAEIANLPEAKRHYAEQWVAFATGRVPNENDACTVDKLSSSMAKDNYPVLSVIADYTQADSFYRRTVGN